MVNERPGASKIVLTLVTGSALGLLSGAASAQQSGGPIDVGDDFVVNTALIDIAVTDAQLDMGRAIGRVCPTIAANEGLLDATGDDLQNICTAMLSSAANPGSTAGEAFGLAVGETNAANQRIAGEELQTVQSELAEIRGLQNSNIGARMSAVRAGLVGPGLSFAGLTIDNGDSVLALQDLGTLEIRPAQAPAETGEESFLDRLGLFATGGVRFGEKDASAQADGFEFDTLGFTAGADYRVTDQLLVGAAFGYSGYDTDFDGNTLDTTTSFIDQDLESDSFLTSLFGSFSPLDALFIDGIFTFGFSDYESTRRIFITNNNATPGSDIGADDIDRTADGEFDAFTYGFAGNVGYDIQIGAGTITPIARFEYQNADIDGFTEEGATGLNLTFGDQDAESLTTNIGVEARYPFSTDFGVVVPSLRGEFIHEFLNDDDGADFFYAADPTLDAAGNPLSLQSLTTEDVDRNYGVIGAGIVAQFPNGYAAFVDYSRIVALELFDNQSVNFGLRKSF